MLDKDLAALYETETKALNLAVKRNLKRFPPDFMFQLNKDEFETLEQSDNCLRLQNETLKMGRGQHSKYLPYVFTEQGVAMLSGVLNSGRAINMNIAIMRAFVEIRKVLLKQTDLKEQMKEIKERLGEHDAQLNQIYDVPIAIGRKFIRRKRGATQMGREGKNQV
jgi:phage regulator Rha-like protein